MSAKPDVWLGIQPCGCIDAAAMNTGENGYLAERQKWLLLGLSVIRVPWAEWESNYRDRFLIACPHQGGAK